MAKDDKPGSKAAREETPGDPARHHQRPEQKRTRKHTVAARTSAAPPPVTPPVIATNAGGDIGYHATSTSTATKTNTPLINIPQAITVITKQQIQDIGAQRIEDVVRYVPGVNWHQGEGNRDQIVIRGQLDRRLLRQRHARRRTDLSRPL